MSGLRQLAVAGTPTKKYLRMRFCIFAIAFHSQNPEAIQHLSTPPHTASLSPFVVGCVDRTSPMNAKAYALHCVTDHPPNCPSWPPPPPNCPPGPRPQTAPPGPPPPPNCPSWTPPPQTAPPGPPPPPNCPSWDPPPHCPSPPPPPYGQQLVVQLFTTQTAVQNTIWDFS